MKDITIMALLAIGMFTGLVLLIAGVALALASPLILIVYLILQVI